MTGAKKLRVFVDSDIIISSLISSRGAASLLLNHADGVELYISNVSDVELTKVVDRLHLDQEELQKLIHARLSKIKLSQSNKELRKGYMDYVNDSEDAHVVAGAQVSNAVFLISCNIRHFKAEKMKQDLGVIVLTPGLFLQYLRSL